MRQAVVVDVLRTPIGRYAGALKDVRPDDLAAHAIRELVRRTGVDPVQVEDVYLGAANQAGEDNRNVARMALLLAGLPETVAGATVNRLCGSGMEAVHAAVRAIRCGDGDVFIAGGVESMTRAPFVMAKHAAPFERSAEVYDTTLGWRFTNPALAARYHPYSMGETAENVAERWQIGRREQDAFALESHRRAVAAWASDAFAAEVVPVPLPATGRPPGPAAVARGLVPRPGESAFDSAPVFARDEHPRPDTSLEKLAGLRPAFKEGGTVTAGNAAGINDGAAALLVVEQARARALGFRPLARIVSVAVAGVDPACMGIGPVPATRKALQRAGLSVADLDLVELNEAFASQSLACIRELGLDPARVNVNGGAIALGHPLGCSGARILTTLIHALRAPARHAGGRYGLATMCIGVGQGIATIVETL